MKPTNGTPRLSAELLATADALRHVRSRVEELARMGHPGVIDSHETTVLLIEVPIVANALDHLAEKLAIEE